MKGRLRKSAVADREGGPQDLRERCPAYETRLDADPGWAMSEGSLFFEGKGAVQGALRKIARRLDELQIPYAVSGGMALFFHGYRRFTEDVDILVSRDGLKKIHEHLEGRGYVPPFTGSKNLRETEHGVRIEFLVAGGFPGDGKPKPVSFPAPENVSIERDGVKVLSLPALIELKLASGMTQQERMKDLADVIELIKVLNLKESFSEQLNVFVRDKFIELYRTASGRRRRYMTIWRDRLLTPGARDLEEMIGTLKSAVATLEAMKEDGVVLDPEGGTAGGHAALVTTDPDVAKKYDMHDESEFWDGDDDMRVDAPST